MALGLTAIGAAAGFMTARHAGGSLTIGGIDIMLGAASQSVLSFTYTDNTSDKADDLSIEIADPARTWMRTYLPKKGVEGQATIKVYNWIAPGDTRLIDCGVFWLDEIGFTGPPNTVSIRATSVPIITGIKTQKKFRFWEGMTLMDIASQIAVENGLALVWDTKENPKFTRVDEQMPDLEFLRDKAKDGGLSIKIYKRQLVMYSEEEYEARPAVYVLLYGASNILGYAFTSRLNDMYKSARNAYVDPKTGKLIETTYEAPEPPEGSDSVLESNVRVDEPEGEGDGAPEGRRPREIVDSVDYSGSDAGGQGLAIAKGKLRQKNKHEKEATFLVVGNPDYLSGLNVQLLDFGIFDGKWFISSSTHSITDAGYVTELKLRGCLNGY